MDYYFNENTKVNMGNRKDVTREQLLKNVASDQKERELVR